MSQFIFSKQSLTIINYFCSISTTKACDFLNDKMPEDAEIEDTLAEFHLTGEQVFKDIQKALSSRKTNSMVVPMDDEDDHQNEKENQSTSNARGSRASKATASKSSASKATATKPSTSVRGRGRGRAAAGPSARNESNVSVRFVKQNRTDLIGVN